MIDFKRAFDLVPFKQMLQKLEAHGVTGDALKWLADWTNGRMQRVVLNGVSSTWTDVLSSVVQGSVLGPILFIVFINDIDLAITDPKTKIFKYADDSKFGRPICSPADAAALQAQIDNIWEWSERWGMKIHPQKTYVLHFGHGNMKYDYSIDGVKISDANTAKDLWVIIDKSCSPSEHVHAITKKANGVLSQLNRTLISRNKTIVTNLFKVFVRPILESAVTAWCPWERQDVDAIERVQRRATRMIPGIGKLPYVERLKICKQTTLEDRRRRGDAIEVYKMLNGRTDINVDGFFCFTSQRHDVPTRTATNKCLVGEKCRLDIRKHFFPNRVVNPWNNLPLDVREAGSVIDFKIMYDDWIQLNTVC